MYKKLLFVLLFSQIFLYCRTCVPEKPYSIGYIQRYYFPTSCSNMVLDVDLAGHTGVYFKFTTENEAISVYTKLYNSDYDTDIEHELYSYIPPNSIYSKYYYFTSGYNYMYIIINPETTYPIDGNTYFTIQTSFTALSGLATVFIVLIVIGSLVCLAIIAMGVAKAMGRSPWEGLACFCILFALCCCRR